jgi:hypothetical protein
VTTTLPVEQQLDAMIYFLDEAHRHELEPDKNFTKVRIGLPLAKEIVSRVQAGTFSAQYDPVPLRISGVSVTIDPLITEGFKIEIGTEEVHIIPIEDEE